MIYKFNSVDLLVLTITKACNLTCPFCLANASIAEGEELTSAQWLTALSYFNHIRAVRISGGEPLMASSVDKTMAVANAVLAQGGNVQINTNGTHALPENCNKKITFQVSLDGTRETHDSIRGQGNFDKTVSFVRDAKSKGHSVSIMSVFTGDYKNLPRFIEFLDSLEVSYSFQIPTNVGRGKENGIKKLYIDYKKLEKFSKKYVRGVFASPCISHFCTGGGYVSLDERGFIVPCPSLQNYKFDHILDIKPGLAKRMKEAITDKNITCWLPQGREDE